MSKTIKQVFSEVASDVVVDAAMVKRIHEYERAFVNRSEDHVKFFGSNLMGVHPLRFKPSDREEWFNDVLQIDELAVVDGIEQVTTIGADWKRATDAMNHSCVWLLHALHHSTKLSPTQKEQAIFETFLILQYKFLGSLMAHYFKYPADEKVMQAAYASLSRKYAIKVAGSWRALLDQRARDMMQPRWIHHTTVVNLGSDSSIVYLINDLQGRLREIVKSYAEVFHRLHKNGERIEVDASTLEIDGQAVLQDRSRKYSGYVRYLHDVVGDKPSFVREELVKVISDAMHTMSPRLLTDTLEWVSRHHRLKGFDTIEKLMDETLIHAFDTMQANRETLSGRGQLVALLTKLRALYMASRMSDPVLLQNKDMAEWVVVQATGSKNTSAVASVRTGLQLYFVVRALAKDHYSR